MSHVWIINDNKQILCQKRSLLKDTSPGKFESLFGGHIGVGVSYKDGAITEVKEELGLDLIDKNLEFWKIYKSTKGHEFQGVFIYKWNGDSKNLDFEKEEIDQIDWFELKEVEETFLNRENENWTKMGYQEELLNYLETKY